MLTSADTSKNPPRPVRKATRGRSLTSASPAISRTSRRSHPPFTPTPSPSHPTTTPRARSVSTRPRPVPHAGTTAPLAPTGPIPGRAYSLAGVPLVSQAEYATLRAEQQSLRETMARLTQEHKEAVDMATQWAQAYHAMQYDIRTMKAERAAADEEMRNLRTGYSAMSRIVEAMRRSVSVTEETTAGGLAPPFGSPPMQGIVEAMRRSVSVPEETTAGGLAPPFGSPPMQAITMATSTPASPCPPTPAFYPSTTITMMASPVSPLELLPIRHGSQTLAPSMPTPMESKPTPSPPTPTEPTSPSPQRPASMPATTLNTPAALRRRSQSLPTITTMRGFQPQDYMGWWDDGVGEDNMDMVE